MVEQKDTEAQSISLKKSWVNKIMEEARDVDKIPALAITLAQGTQEEVTVFVISQPDFLHYRNLISEGK